MRPVGVAALDQARGGRAGGHLERVERAAGGVAGFVRMVERGGAAKLCQRCRNLLLYAHDRANLSVGVMPPSGHAANDGKRPGYRRDSGRCGLR